MLSDPRKRADYDAGGFAQVGGVTPEDLFGRIDFEDLFGGLGFDFGRGSFFDRFFRRGRAGPARGAAPGLAQKGEAAETVTSRSRVHVLLITGSPGVGKTTVIRKVAASLAGRRVGGFYTKEIRAGRERRGFRLVTFDGREWIMAHADIPGPHRVGKYGVDVAAVEEAATSALATGRADLYLLDEIGRMECLSPAFVAAVRKLLDSPATVVATVAVHGDGLVAEVKQRADIEIWTVTRANRDDLPARVLAWLRGA